ncbi:hypothetical protein J8K89_00165 [Bacteroides fragilis]|nr:hypothetical protein [Bacteroides fragilis]MCM0321473.1 hypothetical protein [Bacteroides fragilis]
MLIEERYKDEDTGPDGANSLLKLELSYSAGVWFFLLKQIKRTIINLKIKNLPPNLKKNRNNSPIKASSRKWMFIKFCGNGTEGLLTMGDK